MCVPDSVFPADGWRCNSEEMTGDRRLVMPDLEVKATPLSYGISYG